MNQTYLQELSKVIRRRNRMKNKSRDDEKWCIDTKWRKTLLLLKYRRFSEVSEKFWKHLYRFLQNPSEFLYRNRLEMTLTLEYEKGRKE